MTAIYFDLDGTLLRFEHSFEELFAAACEAVGVALDDVEPVHDFYTERFFEHFGSLADEPFRAAVRETVTEFDLDADADVLTRARLDAEIEGLTVPPGTRDALASLSADHRLGVLTNGVGDLQRAKLAAYDLDQYFETVVASHDVGAVKPDPEIFERARERLPADRHVYVGDSADHDVRPAAELGFLTVHVVDAPENVADEAHAAVAPGEFHRVGDVAGE